MARDLNRLFDDIRRSRDVFVTQDGRVEDADESHENETKERRETGTPRPRTSLKPEVFAGGNALPLSVSLDVLTAIHAEAAQHPGETGGLVVGPTRRCITEFIPSGKGAERTRSSYVLDPSHLQPRLDEAANRGLSFLGIWHSHPEGVPDLSGTDRETAARMLGDKDYGLDEVVLPLSVRTRSGFETRFFLIEGGSDAVVEPQVVVVSGGAAPPLAAANASVAPWEFVSTAAGSRRLKSEQEALTRAGFDTRVRRTKAGVGFFVVTGALDITFLFPPEFPLAPPMVEARIADERVELAAIVKRALRAWTSRSTLVEVAKAIEKSLGTEGPPPATGVLRRLGTALGFAGTKEAA